MIVVLGRPALDARGALIGLAGRIAVAAAAGGARVELVGSVGDDPDGDSAAVELGRSGVGHAALLRDPGAPTPRGEATGEGLPRLDGADIELALRYLTECRVLVLAEQLDPPALHAALDGATYHSAQLVVITNGAGGVAQAQLPPDATLLAAPDEDAGAFALLVGQYAAQLDAGRGAAEAWHDALGETGWESAAE